MYCFVTVRINFHQFIRLAELLLISARGVGSLAELSFLSARGADPQADANGPKGCWLAAFKFL